MRQAIAKQVQGRPDRGKADRFAADVAESMFDMNDSRGPDSGEMDKADGLAQ